MWALVFYSAGLFLVTITSSSCTSTVKEGNNNVIASPDKGVSDVVDSDEVVEVINLPPLIDDECCGPEPALITYNSPESRSGGYGSQGAIQSAATGNPDRDECPDDPNKTEPRICGCGVPEDDNDDDGRLDCVDNCIGLANPDQADSDGDGVGDECDCLPYDQNYTIPASGPSGVACDTGDSPPCSDGELLCVDGNISCVSDILDCEEEEPFLMGEMSFINFPADNMACSDFNGDGYNDLVINSHNDNNISIFFNDGDAAFLSPAIYNAPNQPFDVKAGDLDDDGDIDVVTANFTGSVDVFINIGGGIFDPPVNYLVGGTQVRALELGDMDGDLDLDIVTVASNGSLVSVLQNAGNGTFGLPANYPTAGISPFGVTLGDVDNNGYLDVIASGLLSSVKVLTNNGVVLSDSGTYIVTGGSTPVSPKLGDLNGDGFLDLVVVDIFTSNVYVLLNDTAGAYPTTVSYALPGTSESLELSNIDGDGDLDIIAGLSSSTFLTAVLVNDGDGTFSDPPFTYGLGSTQAIAVCDANNDFRPDISVVTISPSKIVTFLNIYTPPCPCLEFWGLANDIDVRFPQDYEAVNEQCLASTGQVVLEYTKDGSTDIEISLLEEGTYLSGPVCHVSNGSLSSVREIQITIPPDSSFEELVNECKGNIGGITGPVPGTCDDTPPFCPCNEFWLSGNDIGVRFPDDYEAVSNQCSLDNEQVILAYTKNGVSTIAVGFLENGALAPGPACHVSDGNQQQVRELPFTIPAGLTFEEVLTECVEDLVDKVGGSVPGNCSAK